MEKIIYKYQYFNNRADVEADDGGFFSEQMMAETDFNLFLDRLTEPQKTVIRMEVDGHSSQEISDQLNITLNSVYSHKKRAKRLFLALFV